MEKSIDAIKLLIDQAKTIVIIQADNPDADSLGSALALETILHKAGKTPMLYCGVDMPEYLRYLPGWDRVSNDLPKQFDLSIIVDASTITLLEKITASGSKGWLAAKPCIVLDHHAEVENKIDFAEVTINDTESSSTGELIYKVAKGLGWPLDSESGECLMTAILGDTQGLTNQLASAETYKVMAELIELGVDRPELEERRRELSKMSEKIYRYKAELIARTEFHADGRIALVTIPHKEIAEYSPLYNPAPLIQGDMLQTTGVEVAIVIKDYASSKITGAIRCNAPVGAELATYMGGGGHAYASGFKVLDGRPLNQVKSECIEKATELLNNQK